MKLLNVQHYPVFGGPHNQALRLTGILAQRGWESLIVMPVEAGSAAGRLRAAGIEVIQMPLHRLRAKVKPSLHWAYLRGFRREVAALRHLIREHAINLVLVSGLVNPHAAIAARQEGVPIVWQLMSTRPPMLLRRLFMPLVVRWADALMTTGREVARAHPGAEGLGKRLIPFFMPVDVNLFRPDPNRRAAARAELDLAEKDFVIGNVGNFNPMKGHRTFVRAAAALRSKHPQIRFAILGANDDKHARYRAALLREADSLGLRLGEGLIVREPGARVADLAPAFDVFWLTSQPKSEGTPTVVEEAMALGLPVVATDVGSVRELLDDGVEGFIVRPRDPEAIAGAGIALVDDHELRLGMGQAGRIRAERFFDASSCAETHLRAFEVAIERWRRRSGRTGHVARQPAA